MTMHWDVSKASRMWADGVPAGEIATALCIERQYLYNYADKHRDEFPVRQTKLRKEVANYVSTKVATPARIRRPERLPKILPADQVRRVTLSGAIVTLPRIPTIDGYADTPHQLQAAE